MNTPLTARLLVRMLLAPALAVGVVGCAGSQHASRATTPVAAGQLAPQVHEEDGPGEVVIALADLPPAVRAALAAVTPEDRVTRIAREHDGGTVKYDVEYRKDGGAWAAEFSPAGAVLENEPDDEGDEEGGAGE